MSAELFELKADTQLERIPNLDLELKGDQLIITVDRIQIHTDPIALNILSVFSKPISLTEGIKTLQPFCSTLSSWQQMTGTLRQLAQAGILRDPARIQALTPPQPSMAVYDRPRHQIDMTEDRLRVQHLWAAIQEIVQPDDVVLEIGTGIGLNAIAAARAGARHVYALELSAMGKYAPALFAANGFSERITYFQGDARTLELPEKATVLISEISGGTPLSSYPFQVIADAKKRLLTPQARIIPGRLHVYAQPFTVPEDTLTKIFLLDSRLDQWQDWYDIDFSALRPANRQTELYQLNPSKTQDWITLTDPIFIATTDYQTGQGFASHGSGTARVTTAGLLHGVMLFLKLDYSPLIQLANFPVPPDRKICWPSPLYLRLEPQSLAVGDRLQVSYTIQDGHCTVDFQQCE